MLEPRKSIYEIFSTYFGTCTFALPTINKHPHVLTDDDKLDTTNYTFQLFDSKVYRISLKFMKCQINVDRRDRERPVGCANKQAGNHIK